MDTGKSATAFRTISEVSEDIGVPQHVLRFWETRFPAISPLKRGGNRRYYRPDDVQLLRAINRLLYTDGYTIKGVQKLIKDRGPRALLSAGPDGAAVSEAPPSAVAAPAPAVAAAQIVPPEHIAELRAIRTLLAEALARAA